MALTDKVLRMFGGAGDKEMRDGAKHLKDSAYITRLAYSRLFGAAFAFPALYALYAWYEYRILESSAQIPEHAAAVCKYTVRDERDVLHERALPTTPSSVNRTIWDRLAPHFDGHLNRVETFFGVDDRREELCALARGRVLEVGGGTCRNVDYLLDNKNVTSYTTIDFSAAMLEATVRNVTRTVLKHVRRRDGKGAADGTPAPTFIAMAADLTSRLGTDAMTSPANRATGAAASTRIVGGLTWDEVRTARAARLAALRTAETGGWSLWGWFSRKGNNGDGSDSTVTLAGASGDGTTADGVGGGSAAPAKTATSYVEYVLDRGALVNDASINMAVDKLTGAVAGAISAHAQRVETILRRRRSAFSSADPLRYGVADDVAKSEMADAADAALTQPQGGDAAAADGAVAAPAGAKRWWDFYQQRWSLASDRLRPLGSAAAARGLAIAAAAEWPAAPFPIHVQLADVQYLPYEDETFDTVIDTFGLCSFEDPFKAIEEMVRVVKKKDGRVLLLEHGRSDLSDFLNHIILDRRAVRHAQDWGCWWNREIPLIAKVGGLKLVHHSSFGMGSFHTVIGRPYRDGEKRDPDVLSYFMFVKPGSSAPMRALQDGVSGLTVSPTRYPDELAREAAKKQFEKKVVTEKAKEAAIASDW